MASDKTMKTIPITLKSPGLFKMHSRIVAFDVPSVYNGLPDENFAFCVDIFRKKLKSNLFLKAYPP